LLALPSIPITIVRCDDDDDDNDDDDNEDETGGGGIGRLPKASTEHGPSFAVLTILMVGVTIFDNGDDGIFSELVSVAIISLSSLLSLNLFIDKIAIVHFLLKVVFD